MEKYAIYRYKFVDTYVTGNLFEKNYLDKSDKSDEKRKIWLDRLFGPQNTTFSMKKYNKNDAADLPCTVMAHTEQIVLIRLVNPKQVTVWQEEGTVYGGATNIDKRKIPSSPYIYVVIDCREGRNMIAVEIDKNVWRSTDDIANLLEVNINRHLEKLNRGFSILISPVLLPIDFIEHSYKLIKKNKLRVTKMTVFFTRGLIDPKVEEIIKKDAYLKDLVKRMFESRDVELTYNYPNGMRIIDRRSKMLEHFVMLIGSEQKKDAFRLRISYDDGTSYICGKDTRMEFMMDDAAFLGMLGIESLFPEQQMGFWLDNVASEIKRTENDTETK